MYKTYTPDYWKDFFKLGNEYNIEAFLSYGTWDVEKYFNFFKKTLTEIRPDTVIKRLDGFLSNILEVTIDNKKYWYSVVYGGTQLSEYLHLACQFGSKRNIHIGSCGGLCIGSDSMDLLIPTYSYGDDSITRIYNRQVTDNKHFSDSELSSIIKSKIPKTKKIITGPVISCMAMMGETLDDIRNWSNDGYFGVEMETSTLFSVSRHFNVPAAALLYISDNLIKNQTIGDTSYQLQKEARDLTKKDIYRVGIEILFGI